MSKRTEGLKIRISPEDKERIKLKMEDAGILNMSAYIRKMALDEIWELTRQSLARLAAIR